MQDKFQKFFDKIGIIFISIIFVSIVGFGSYIGYKRNIECNKKHSFLYCVATQKNWYLWDNILK